MPETANSISYLPMLLVSVSHSAAPDDSSFDTPAAGQVDYLSHEWREEDVWRSWRSMTRQKNAIANGIRLENASWRTWWKQRNKLKTISPETLNWLKDSDVTWLYGPLHLGPNWTPTPEHASPGMHPVRRTDSMESTSRRQAPPKKPILKHRSISQLLTLPASPLFNNGYDDIDEEEEHDQHEHDHHGSHGSQTPTRPPLLHTKSDTHISWRRPFRKDSPPRIIAEESTSALPLDSPSAVSSVTAPSTDVSRSGSSEHDVSTSSSNGPDMAPLSDSSSGPKKKHISFNTFVEQCIAIEKPKTKRAASMNSGHPRRPPFYEPSFDDGYDEDSEAGYDDDYNQPSSFYLSHSDGLDTDSDEDDDDEDEDDDDDALEIRTSSSRSRSSSLSSRPGHEQYMTSPMNEASLYSSHPRPPLFRHPTSDNQRVTIAPIAPTILKSTGVGNDEVAAEGSRMGSASKEVELVYVPPSHSNYSLPSSPVPNEEVYHYRESYFSVGTNNTSPLREGAPIPSVGMPVPAAGSAPVPVPARNHFGGNLLVDSPMQMDEVNNSVDEDVHGYFGGQDAGREYDLRVEGRASPDDVREDDVDNDTGTSMTRYAEGGASSVLNGRNNGYSHDMPVVVVNEANGAMEERTERSRESSPTSDTVNLNRANIYSTPVPSSFKQDAPIYSMRPPSATAPSAIPVPRIGATHPHVSFSPSVTVSVVDAGLLSPPDSNLSSYKGRLPSHSPSVSGSTTSSSANTYSYSHSSDSRSESRGRSSTRNSSFSDRERSGSRGTNSPIGSISPTGSSASMGVGIGAVYASGRKESRGRGDKPKKGKEEEDHERGRERTGRRLGDSLSPPQLGSGNESDYQPYSPILLDSPQDELQRASPPSSVSGSSTASVSTIGPSKAQIQSAREGASTPPTKPRIDVGAALQSVPEVPVPSPMPDEEEQRSRQPTPANSPVTAFASLPVSRDSAPSPPPTSSRFPWSPLVSPSVATTSPVRESASSPTRTLSPRRGPSSPQDGTLVGRAVDIVSSARDFFGSMWGSSSS